MSTRRRFLSDVGAAAGAPFLTSMALGTGSGDGATAGEPLGVRWAERVADSGVVELLDGVTPP